MIKKLLRKMLGLERISAGFENQIYWSARQNVINHLLNDSDCGVTDERYGEHEIIVSMTTFGSRIYEVALTIETLMRQTLKPNRIILWLSEEEFRNVQLPKSLAKMRDRGLEINYCKDIRSYKKLIPTLKMFPDAVVITVDDDVLYDYDVVEKLVMAHLHKPNVIFCNRKHKIRLDEKGSVLPYNQWLWDDPDLSESVFNMPTGVGGILYPSDCFDDDVFDENVFMDICRYADDIWFKAMALKKGFSAQKVYTHDKRGRDYIVNSVTQSSGLFTFNTMGPCLNDQQFKDVFSKYNLIEKLRE